MSAHHVQLDRRRWHRLRKHVLARDGYRCKGCGAAGRLEVDHIRPLARKGAAYDADNCQTLCRNCHIIKSRGERQSANPVPGQAAWTAEISQLALFGR